MSRRSPGKVCEPNTPIPRSLAKAACRDQAVAISKLHYSTPGLHCDTASPLAGLSRARRCHSLTNHPKSSIWGGAEGGQVRARAGNYRFLALRSSSGCGSAGWLGGIRCRGAGLEVLARPARDASVAASGCCRGRVGSCRVSCSLRSVLVTAAAAGVTCARCRGFAFGAGQPAAARYDVCVSYGRRAARTGFGLGVPGRTTQVRHALK
jgi:hypothetical protein